MTRSIYDNDQFMTAFKSSYDGNVAYAEDDELNEFCDAYRKNEENGPKKFDNYTNLMDAIGVFQDGIEFAQEQLDFSPKAMPPDARSFYVSGVQHTPDGKCLEQTDDDHAEFYSVYAKDSQGLSHCLADLPTRLHAENLTDLLAGLRHERN